MFISGKQWYICMLRLGEERMIPRSLIAAVHYTCLRDAREHWRRQRLARYRAPKTKGLETHPRTIS